MTTMNGVVLPGNSTVEHVEKDVPEPGPGQVLLAMKASSICGSDIRAIYREHLGHGPEAYQGVVAGHEPCGQVVAVGPECRKLEVGDRVAVYHIAGCGVCDECRSGYMIGCTSPHRAAYGWQRDGGHAEYLLAEEADLPAAAGRSCRTSTARWCPAASAPRTRPCCAWTSPAGTRLLVTGLGPVGLAAAMLGRALGAGPIIGTDIAPERLARRRAASAWSTTRSWPATTPPPRSPT